MKNKLLPLITILLVALISETLFWNNLFILSTIFILLAILKQVLYPIKKELLWYFLVGFGGAIFEIIIVNIGNGWTYNNPQIFGIPFWIPLFWGLIGTTSISLYKSITKEK